MIYSYSSSRRSGGGVPMLLAPANLTGTIESSLLDSDWDSVFGAVGYEYELINDETDETTGVVDVGNVTSLTDVAVAI